VVSAIQNLSGKALSGYSMYILEQVGLDPADMFDLILTR